jgi:hypothetical protein
LSNDVAGCPQGRRREGIALGSHRNGENFSRVSPGPNTPTDIEKDVEEIREYDNRVVGTVTRVVFCVPL